MGMCSIVYAFTKRFRNESWMPLATFVYVMGHFVYRLFQIQIISVIHEKLILNFQHIDPSTPMMLMVLRLTTFAWNVYDGTLRDEDVISSIRHKVVKEFPSLIEFFGYTMFFPTFVTGPSLDFMDYREYINETGAFQKIPSRIWPTLQCVGLGLFFCGIYAVYMDTYSYLFMSTSEFVDNFNIWQRIYYCQMSGIVARAKYYGIFKMAEGVCNLVGIGYTGNGVWNRGQGVSIRDVEFGQSFKQLLDNWNMKTARWLRNCIYIRFTNQKRLAGGKKQSTSFVTFVTFMVSALWHGFHAGYYLTFGVGAMFPILARSMRRYFRPLILEPSSLAWMKPLYDLLGWFFTWTSLNFVAAPFVVWQLEKSLAVWGSLHYYAVIVLISGFVLVDGVGGGKWILKNVGKQVGVENVSTRSKQVPKKEN
ncbi:lysophospholipid acyltransferase [Physocladia obscura]|uniref:Lysophospholipid acyltransferase n=1 Tax=Physocladia obscura TaxID=109957 RepID=A0AAD5T5K8_9FUNG|nr:lysophospholipid acyltransferase [Physocladia obscura]